MTNLNNIFKFVLVTTIIISACAHKCQINSFVYGRNEVFDQLMLCSLAKTSDLDLIPRNGQTKSTSSVLIEHGFANKTSVVSAKLNGLWSLRRAQFVDTAWKCQPNQTVMSAIVELNGVALDVIERIDIPQQRRLPNTAQPTPCKTMSLSSQLCRPNKSIYKTTRTWVNQAYFNVTLIQGTNSFKPMLDEPWLMFTCPESFKQKIVHSPSSSYIISRQARNSNNRRRSTSKAFINDQDDISISHPLSFSSTQDGKGPVVPPYHNSVSLIESLLKDSLRKSIGECIDLIDSDLSLVTQDVAFSIHRFQNSSKVPSGDLTNRCSDKEWLRQRAESAIATDLRKESEGSKARRSQNTFKRSKTSFEIPADQDRLLNPYGHYHDEYIDIVLTDHA